MVSSRWTFFERAGYCIVIKYRAFKFMNFIHVGVGGGYYQWDVFFGSYVCNTISGLIVGEVMFAFR